MAAHDATIDWHDDWRGFIGFDGYQGICSCGWVGPVRGEDREWAQEDCTWHETQMRIEQEDCRCYELGATGDGQFHTLCPRAAEHAEL